VGYTYHVEKERANRSVGFFAYSRLSMAAARGFSPIFITAAISVLVLLSVMGWEMSQSLDAKNSTLVPVLPAGQNPFSALQNTGGDVSLGADTATSSDPLSNIGAAVMNQLEGSYMQLLQAGVYSTSSAEAAGQSLAPYLAANVSYQTFSPADIHTDSDTSYARMLKYRSDLRTSLSPLLKNTEPEFEIFASYAETKDAAYLTKLAGVAANYRAAASSTANVIAPGDAAIYHVGILNAMEEFAATLDAMALHASDPFASVALLRGYNKAESDMVGAFNALTIYYKSKKP
jgi:hypothetical protein